MLHINENKLHYHNLYILFGFWGSPSSAQVLLLVLCSRIIHSWWGLVGDHRWCWEPDLVRLCTKQAPYPLYDNSGHSLAPFKVFEDYANTYININYGFSVSCSFFTLCSSIAPQLQHPKHCGPF